MLGNKLDLMIFRKHLLAAIIGATIIGNAGIARAAQGVVIEVLVHSEGVEIMCTTAQCVAVCRDVEGMQVLLDAQPYRIGANCSITLGDINLLQDAVEELIALLGDVFPGGEPLPPGLAPDIIFLDDTTGEADRTTQDSDISPVTP